MASINDIAKELGLSATTISRVLNNKGDLYRISKATQLKVRELAEKLHYVPNEYAANLRSGKTNTIALSIPSFMNPFFGRIASNLNKELRELGFLTIFNESDENESIEADALKKLRSRNIEGLIIAPSGSNSKEIRILQDKGLPIVCVDRYFEDDDIPYVATDNFIGGYEATKYLINNGHRNIACLQGNKSSVPNRKRVEGYLKALEDANLNKTYIAGDSFSEKNGYLETKLLLQNKEKISAIFTLSNTIAIGSLQALAEEGVKVPDDISIITFDDASYLSLFSTPITSIAQPIEDISKLVIKILMAKLANNPLPINQILLKPKIIHRSSVIPFTDDKPIA